MPEKEATRVGGKEPPSNLLRQKSGDGGFVSMQKCPEEVFSFS